VPLVCSRLDLGLTLEQGVNYVPSSFSEVGMVRVVVGEVAALISLVLFLATVAVWAQLLGAL
jgi:hypothetical protein